MATKANTAPRAWSPGDRVAIADHSEAHGDTGTVLYTQGNGIVVVELDQGCAWPVFSGDELLPLESEDANG